MRVALLDELSAYSPTTLDEFEAVLDKEFSVFKKGEKYSYVKDIKYAFNKSLATSTAE